ncbi:hypothetical protein D3877_16000 [Azospirillum cavernae]|uniref:Uncharacterized protein n=1 Tax=Azospirillum cavernae TaxID=2320860 RepID=A0A418VWV7_9PROT|nr:hypothetical protein [Azospirillum cavernae]RJF81632.1 hypothetical protein D3877_16000 [Azospirillum cavernae]
MPTPPPANDRARVAANLGALVAVAILLALGYWLTGALARQSKLEDCLLAHRRQCGAVETPPS